MPLDILRNSTTRLKISDIRTDGGTQPRAGLVSQIIVEYAEAITGPNNWPFPPIIVFHDGSAYWLADGFHRLAAAKMYADREKLAYSVVADVRQGTQRDAILYSVGANSDHGLRRTSEDKRRAVMRLLEDSEWSQWSNREIARRCNVDEKTVRTLRDTVTAENPQLERTYTTKHGTVATMNTAKIGATKPATASVDDLTRHIGSWLSQQIGTPTESLSNAASRDSVTRRHLELFLGRRDVAFNRDNLETAIAEVMANVVNTGTQERQTAPSTDNGYTIVRNPRTGVAIPQLIGKTLVQAFDNEDYQLDEREAAADAAAQYQDAQPEPKTVTQSDPALFTSKSAEHYTPDEIIHAVLRVLETIDLDPCSNSHQSPNVPAHNHYTSEDNGLLQYWQGKVYMNPPYGDGIDAWIAKLVEAYEGGDVTEAIALIPARTDTKWWQRLRDYPICFIKGRLKFKGEDNHHSAPFPSAVVYLGTHHYSFGRAFAHLGDTYLRMLTEY